MRDYLKLAGEYPPLSAADEVCLLKAASAGCLRSRDRLVLTYARWIVFVASRQAKKFPEIGREDAIQIGFVAAMAAISGGKYQPSKGTLINYLGTSVSHAVFKEAQPKLLYDNTLDPFSKEAAPDERAIAQERSDAVTLWIGEALRPLDQEIVRQRYGFDGEPKTFKELGKAMRSTKQWASQINERALSRGRESVALKEVAYPNV